MSLTLRYQNHVVEPSAQETALDALLRVGADVAFSCKGGSCLTCLLQCTDGDVPETAQRGLSEHLRKAHYLLPCKCVPTTSMTLGPKQPQDMITRCMLCETSGHASGAVQVAFEPMRSFDYRTGQTLRLVTGEAVEPELVLTSDPAKDMVLHATLRLAEGARCPDWLGPDAAFGQEFEVRGPFQLPASSAEQPAPEPDPALWAELDHGRIARAVLEAFYAKVYADPLLSPFFERTTMDRAIDKQFSFLKQCLTGEKIYFGDRPRNAHHWMIITPALFDHRQALMIETLRAHGLSEDQIRRWTRHEEHFRPDIVKGSAWPRRIGDEDVVTEGFAQETLGEATVCDHCGCAIDAGVTVLYHRRLGTVSCAACAAGQKTEPAGAPAAA